MKTSKRIVLGIDAAWTLAAPSGVALAIEGENGWRLAASHGTYEAFTKQTGTPTSLDLLGACEQRWGRRPDLVAIDMPLSHQPIIGRREADDAVSRAYGGRKCGTHTPSKERPGSISDELREGFGQAGYPLLTRQVAPPGLIEVYPHPALLHLTGAAERLPYKVSKMRSYWPNEAPEARRDLLKAQWRRIVAALDTEIAGVRNALPELTEPRSGKDWKTQEDKIDAVVCAWVGIRALQNEARPFGDDDAAIWIPF